MILRTITPWINFILKNRIINIIVYIYIFIHGISSTLTQMHVLFSLLASFHKVCLLLSWLLRDSFIRGVWWDGSKSHRMRHFSREVICCIWYAWEIEMAQFQNGSKSRSRVFLLRWVTFCAISPNPLYHFNSHKMGASCFVAAGPTDFLRTVVTGLSGTL